MSILGIQKNHDKRGFFDGAPRGDRTPDLVVRSHALYPTELGVQDVCLALFLDLHHLRPRVPALSL